MMRRLLFGLICLILIVGLIPITPIQATSSVNQSKLISSTGNSNLISGNVIINTNQTASTRYEPQRKIAITSDGHIHTVYNRKNSNGVNQIYHSESSNGGVNWIEEAVTNEPTNQVLPSLAVDSYWLEINML
jgi:hypothetical protein